MKQFLRYGLILAVATSGFVFAACEGEDGDPGAAGPQGEQGNKGDTGANGEDGVGFDEALQYGNVVVQFKGTRPDGVAFNKTIDFKFCPSGPDAIQASRLMQYDDDFDFLVSRYNAVGLSDNYNYATNSVVSFRLYKSVIEEESSLEVSIAAGITDNTKFFMIYDNYEFPVTDETVTGYSFNAATGELKYTFHGVFPAIDNDTNHDLEITADVNVKVLQNLVTPK